MVGLKDVLIVAVILLAGIPIGRLLAYYTKEELAGGQIWFKILIGVSMIGSIVSLIFRQDALMITFLFIAIVTSRSLKR